MWFFECSLFCVFVGAVCQFGVYVRCECVCFFVCCDCCMCVHVWRMYVFFVCVLYVFGLWCLYFSVNCVVFYM